MQSMWQTDECALVDEIDERWHRHAQGPEGARGTHAASSTGALANRKSWLKTPDGSSLQWASRPRCCHWQRHASRERPRMPPRGTVIDGKARTARCERRSSCMMLTQSGLRHAHLNRLRQSRHARVAHRQQCSRAPRQVTARSQRSRPRIAQGRLLATRPPSCQTHGKCRPAHGSAP